MLEQQLASATHAGVLADAPAVRAALHATMAPPPAAIAKRSESVLSEESAKSDFLDCMVIGARFYTRRANGSFLYPEPWTGQIAARPVSPRAERRRAFS
jgi:hypothetical protein